MRALVQIAVLGLLLPTASLRQTSRVRAPRASVTEPSSSAPPIPGRAALTALATAGAVETGAIALDKLTGAGALDGLCSVTGGGCADVLNGPWASVAGVPLALFGAIAYSAVAVLAAAPYISREYEAPSAGPLLFGTAALSGFSSCLMLLLLLVIQQPCALCFTSAAISTALAAVAWRSPVLDDRTEAAVFAGGGVIVSFAAAVVLYAMTGTDLADDGLGRPPKIASHSTSRALDVATALKARGGRFYGAFWCSHCANQKETLGVEAMAIVPYLECDEQGFNTKRSECQAAGIRGYPTWQLDGQLFPGEKDLGELEEMLRGDIKPDP